MDVRKRITIGVLVLSGLAAAGTAPALADDSKEEVYPVVKYETIPKSVERVFFESSKTFFGDITISHQASQLFWSYPELEITSDAKKTHKLYDELMLQQTSSDPIIRTLDVPSPFNTSIRVSPDMVQNSIVVGSEFVYERVPLP